MGQFSFSFFFVDVGRQLAGNSKTPRGLGFAYPLR